MKILIVEDDEETRKYLAAGLATEGFAVDCAANGRDALFLASGSPYDLIVVDRLLPGMDGLSLVKVLRGASVSVPILFLTALDGIDERVAGLDAGGDDYLVKPFAFSEFTARVRALLRRPPLSDQEVVLRVGDLVLDRTSREVTRQGQRIDLQPREYPAARIPDAPQRRDRDAHHAAGARLGFPFRSAHLGGRNPHQPPAHQDRQAVRAQADQDRARRRILDQ